MDRKFVKIFLCSILWIIAVCCEMVVGEMILHADQYSAGNLPLAFSVHALASLLSFLVFWSSSIEKQRGMKFYSFLCGLMTLFLPLIGLLGATGSFLFVRFILKKKGHFSTSEDPLENDDREPLLFEDMSDAYTLVREETNIEPIMDIINGDDPAMKRGAINLLRQMGSKEAIQLLKKCISDPNEEVRFYTSAALKKLNDAYIQRLKEVKEKIAGEKPSTPNFQKLGDICKDYAESGLCDQSARDYYLGLAKEAFFEVHILDPENFVTTTSLGYVCIELKEYEEAERYLRRSVTINPDHADAILWLCRLYYEKWDLQALVENLQSSVTLYPSELEDPNSRELFNFWTKKDRVCTDDK